jgi:allophanate hydrolase subunit 2
MGRWSGPPADLHVPRRAVVATVDLPAVAQPHPGDEVGFRPA